MFLNSIAAPALFRPRLRLVVWLLCAGVLLALHAKNGLDSDEGVILNGAWNLLNGRMLYTDFFEYIGPASFYLVFAAWKLFGPHFWVAKLLGILAVAAAVAGTYRTGLLFLSGQDVPVPRWACFAAPLVYSAMSGYWPTINHNTFNIALVVWSVYFTTRSILHQSFRDACIGGLLAGIAILFLQHRGLVVAAVATLFLGCLYARTKNAVWRNNLAGCLAGALVPAVAMLFFWPGSLLIENLFVFPATRYPEVNRLDSSLFLITACALLVAAWLLRDFRNRGVSFLIVLQGALFLTTLQRPDFSHITSVLFPALALFPLLLAAAPKSSRISRLFLFWYSGSLLIPVLPLAAQSLTDSFWFVDKSNDLTVQFVRTTCTSSPYIYAGPFAPGWYFETRKLNPTRYGVLLTNLNTDAQFLEAKNDVEASRPQCVITNYATVEKFNYDKDNVLDQYIASNYELAFRAGPVHVFALRAAEMNR